VAPHRNSALFRRRPLAFAGIEEAIMEPITVTVNGAKEALGIGTTKLYELMNEGKLERVRVGRRVLIKTASIRALVGEAA
jgi:excisionase family DNA binding protein